MKTVFLFPGQGVQKEGMLRSMLPGDVFSKKVFAETEEVLEMPYNTLDTSSRLRSTAYVQVCLLIAGVISARRLLASGVKPDFVAGHSIGAFTAAVLSGVLSFKQALPLVFARGLLMQRAYPTDYGMAALVGYSETRLKQFLIDHNKTHPAVYLANVNTDDQLVVAGRIDSIQTFIASLDQSNLRKAKILNMTVPSHCELMSSVSFALKDRMSALTLNNPVFPYISNCSGRLLKTADAIGEDLWKSVATTVRWADGMGLLNELGAGIFIEMEPSGVLTKMIESSYPQAKLLPVQEDRFEDVTWLWKKYQLEQLTN